MSSVFVVDACRTPVGKVKGALADVRPDHLAADIRVRRSIVQC